jgi:hypothetical protein
MYVLLGGRTVTQQRWTDRRSYDGSTFLRWIDKLPVGVQGACKIKRLELQIPSLFTFEDVRSTLFLRKYESRKEKH